MRFDADFLQELKYNNEIVSLISAYVPLKKAGRLMAGLCPFHTEKSPSFMVYPDTQSYYCFGCGAGGDAISFVMARENLDYVEAVRFLCDRAGMSVPESDEDREFTNLRGRLLEMNKEAARFYFKTLFSPAGAQALDYLKNRGFDPPIVRRFGLGYAPDSFQALCDHLKAAGYNETEMTQGWLAGRSKRGNLYDHFRNRVMFPVFDLRGNVIAFSGRTLDKEESRKYLNSGDTAVFQKSRNLFAMNFAKNKAAEFLLICEGNLDVVAMHKAGFENAVASLGTALTEEQVRMMASYTKEVVLSYDADGPGQKATARAIPLLQAQGLTVRVLRIPDAKDPDEYIKKFGAVRFARLVAESQDATSYLMERQKEGADLSDPLQKGAYIKRLLPTLARLSHVEQDLQLSKLSEELGIAKEAIAADLRSYLKAGKRKAESAERRDFSIAGRINYDKVAPDRNKNFNIAVSEELLLGFLLSHPDYYGFCARLLAPEDFVTELNRKVAKTLFSNLAAGKGADLCQFGDDFSTEEIGRITGMMARLTPVAEPEAVLRECAQKIKAAGQRKSGEQVAEMDNDDLRSFIDGLRQKKE